MIYLKFFSSLKYIQWRVCSHSHEAASKLLVVVQSLSCVWLRDPTDCSVLASPCCPSSSPWACPSSYPLSRWFHPSISYSVVPFSSGPQCFPTSGFFLRTWLFASGGQSIGVSASASVPPMNILDWFPLGLTGLISMQSKGLWRVFSNTTVQKH